MAQSDAKKALDEAMEDEGGAEEEKGEGEQQSKEERVITILASHKDRIESIVDNDHEPLDGDDMMKQNAMDGVVLAARTNRQVEEMRGDLNGMGDTMGQGFQGAKEDRDAKHKAAVKGREAGVKEVKDHIDTKVRDIQQAANNHHDAIMGYRTFTGFTGVNWNMSQGFDRLSREIKSQTKLSVVLGVVGGMIGTVVTKKMFG